MPRLSSLWMWGRIWRLFGLGFNGEVCLAALAVEALGVLGEQQGCFAGVLEAFVEVGRDCLLELETLRGDLPGAGLKGLRGVVAVP